MKIIEGIHGRIIFASFASNIFPSPNKQLRPLLRPVVRSSSLDARWKKPSSMESSLATSRSLLEPLSSQMRSKTMPNEILIMCTGSQGEPMAALSRIANGTHRQCNSNQGDTVIFSSSPIPGNTTSVNKLINTISEAGVEVIHGKINNIHTSGHGGNKNKNSCSA